jgi:hypothetical protein
MSPRVGLVSCAPRAKRCGVEQRSLRLGTMHAYLLTFRDVILRSLWQWQDEGGTPLCTGLRSDRVIYGIYGTFPQLRAQVRVDSDLKDGSHGNHRTAESKGVVAKEAFCVEK